MAIKEINERWNSIQEKRAEINDKYSEGEDMVLLEELNRLYVGEIHRFRQELIEAGLTPILAKAISDATFDWDDWDLLGE